MRLALYEPEIPQNAGTMMRMAACLEIAIDVIEPCGFVLGERRMRRAGLDYLDWASVHTHVSWTAYEQARHAMQPRPRLVVLTTHASLPYTAFRFHASDALLVGRESAGLPDSVHAVADARLRVPMAAGCRSLNVAIAAAMVCGEALRQTGSYPS